VIKALTAIGGLSTWACLGVILMLLVGIGVVACAAFSSRQDPALRIVEIIRAWRGESPARSGSAQPGSEARQPEVGAAPSPSE